MAFDYKKEYREFYLPKSTPSIVAVARMHEYMTEQGYALDITDRRLHQEIYQSDARKVSPEKRKTVIRHPIREV